MLKGYQIPLISLADDAKVKLPGWILAEVLGGLTVGVLGVVLGGVEGLKGAGLWLLFVALGGFELVFLL